MTQSSFEKEPPRSEPVLFAPMPLVVLIGFMLGLHTYRVFVPGLFEDTDIAFLNTTAFVPARFSLWAGLASVQDILTDIAASSPSMRGLRQALFQAFVADGSAKPWTMISYSLLHANWEHVIFNCLWMLAFGSPVMHRFGVTRFLLFFAVTAAAAAIFHAFFNQTDVAVLVGASGAVSGLTAAALRFAIGNNGFGGRQSNWMSPAEPLMKALQNKGVIVFILVWFGINLLAGIGIPVGTGTDVRIAWEAHVGGFLAGLLLFAAFDPVGSQNAAHSR
ncbi:MAG: rhomboid family intramembrane serine protease [Beijerinckiaceae bacterium]